MYQYNNTDSNVSENNLRIYNFINIANRCTNISKCNDNSFLGHFVRYYYRNFGFYLTGNDKLTLLSKSDIQSTLNIIIPISVQRINNITYLDFQFYDFVVNDKKIYRCTLQGIEITDVYQICEGSLPHDLYMHSCRKCICVTKLLFPSQKHLHSDIGIIILIEQQL